MHDLAGDALTCVNARARGAGAASTKIIRSGEPNVAWVSEMSIDLAVLRLFRQRNGFSCGSRCLYSELERRWRVTGLRRTDLARAIERLEIASCLKVHDIVPGQDVELLLEGYRRLIPAMMSSGDWVQTIRAVVHLWRARSRTSQPGSPPGDRRDCRSPPEH